jgi:hypothetical protein
VQGCWGVGSKETDDGDFISSIMLGSLLLLGGHECGIGWKYLFFWNNKKASQQTAKER